MSSSSQMGTAVLVHGAWADGYCWSNVIFPLKSKGFAVTCAPIPLTSFEDDASALASLREPAVRSPSSDTRMRAP